MHDTRSRPSRRGTVARTATMAVLAALALAWAATFDLFAAGARHHWLVPVITLTPVGLVALLAFASRERALRAAGAGLAVLAVLLTLVPWHPRKVFAARLDSIEKGMTVDEVEAIIGGYIKGHGWAIPDELPPPEYPEGEARAHATGTMIYRWNTTSASYNADWGKVEFQDGKVVAVDFLPD